MTTKRKSEAYIAFGNRLRQARLNSSCPERAALAEKAGISINTLRNYENGESNPPAPVLAKLCNVLAVDAAWLYGLYPKEAPVQCPLMEATKQTAGKHEAATVKAEKAKREKEEAGKAAEPAPAPECPPEAADLSESIATLDQLIDAMDDLLKVMPGYLIEGNALREALQGDPNGDKAPAYVSLLSSQPGVVNFYRDRTHMRGLTEAGTISMEEYEAWYIGRREKLAHTAVKKHERPKAPCKGATERSEALGESQEVAGAAADKIEKPRLKCTAEKL